MTVTTTTVTAAAAGAGSDGAWGAWLPVSDFYLPAAAASLTWSSFVRMRRNGVTEWRADDDDEEEDEDDPPELY